MKSLSNLYACLFSALLSSCVQQNLTPIPPTYPFKIEGYSVFIGDDKPGSYDVITIGDYTYCYFYKRLEDDGELFIYDKNCDLHSDRVIVMSGNKIMAVADTKHLKIELVLNLDHILQNHIKNIVKETTIF